MVCLLLCSDMLTAAVSKQQQQRQYYPALEGTNSIVYA